MDGHHRKPVVQILSEFAVGDGLFQVFVGRRHHAHVHRDVFVGTDARNLVLLQGTQDLGLRVGAHVPDFIEEQRAALGLLKLALALRHGAGERPLLVAKQLALDQLPWDGRTVDLHKRPLGAGRAVVNLAGHQFLARSVRPGDQHPRFGGRHSLDHAQDVPDCLGLPHNGVRLGLVGLLLQDLGGFHECLPLQHVPECDQHTVQVQRLLDEVVRALLQRGHGRVDRAVSGNHDHRRLHALFRQHVEHVEAIHLGHFDVAKDAVELGLGRGEHPVHPRRSF